MHTFQPVLMPDIRVISENHYISFDVVKDIFFLFLEFFLVRSLYSVNVRKIQFLFWFRSSSSTDPLTIRYLTCSDFLIGCIKEKIKFCIQLRPRSEYQKEKFKCSIINILLYWVVSEKTTWISILVSDPKKFLPKVVYISQIVIDPYLLSIHHWTTLLVVFYF
jgi:hypothetical protein